MLTVKYDDGGVPQSLELMADSFAELGPVFRPYAKYMRTQVDQVFKSSGQGEWAQRAEASQAQYDDTKQSRIAKLEANKYASLASRLRSETKRARRGFIKASGSGADSKLTKRRLRSVERYEAQQQELQRLTQGGERSGDRSFKKFYGRVERRDQRAAEMIAAVESGQLLGRIANSFNISWDKSSWTMRSEIPWAGAHESGATVGHGAKLPARPFLHWTRERLDKFVELANAHVLAAFRKRDS